MLNFHAYIKDAIACNRFAQREKFHPCACSGIGHLEDLLSGLRAHQAFVCVSDVTDDSLLQRGGSWFKRRVFTVFVIRRWDTRTMESYRAAMASCRELTRQLHSLLLRDEQDLQRHLTYIDVSEIRSRELGGQFLNGATGLYFMLAMDEPTDLRYNEEEWAADTPVRRFGQYFN